MRARENLKVMVDILEGKLSKKEMMSKYKLSSSQLSSLKTRMKSVEGINSLLHTKWNNKIFKWTSDMA